MLSCFSCVRLCDPIDSSSPGSSIPGILQARTLEWVAISFSKAWKWKVKVKSLSRVWLFATMDCNPPGSSIHGIFYGEEKVKSENCNHFQPNHGMAECGLKQGMTMKHPFIYWGLFFLSKVRNYVLTWEVLWWLFQKAWHIVLSSFSLYQNICWHVQESDIGMLIIL